MIATMTATEAAAYLRAHGLKISNASLAAGLEAGIFPFGHAFKGDGKQRVIMIFKRLLDEWIEERSVEDTNCERIAGF